MPVEGLFRKTVCIDIDGTICGEGAYPYYQLAKLLPGAHEKIWTFRTKGYTIILYTARHPEDRKETEDWLLVNNIPYDLLILGKPKADVYIDDRAIKFTGWEAIDL